MSEWERVALGEVTRQVQDLVRVESGETYRLLGVRWYGEGPFHRETVTSGTSKATRLFRVREGQFIYNRLFAWKGSFGLVGAGLDGSYVSNEFPLFECDRERLLPEFLNLQFKNPNLWAHIERASTGTTASRNRWKEAQFNAFAIPLPPLEEQRRIVDVVASVDAQIEALEAEAGRAGRALGPITEHLASEDPGWLSRPLGEVGVFLRGKRFTKADYTDAGLGVIHYSHVHTHFGPIAEQPAAYVPDEFRSRLRLAGPGDVVIAATSEDLAGVGKATVWLGEGEVAVHDDAQIYRHSLDPLYAAFVFAAPAFHRQKVKYAGGTKVTRISGSDLAKIEVPVPPVEDQVRIGAALAAVTRETDALRSELSRLRMFRSVLLTSLLNQDIEIPDSYDHLLEHAV